MLTLKNKSARTKRIRTDLDFWIKASERQAAEMQVLTGHKTLLLYDQVPDGDTHHQYPWKPNQLPSEPWLPVNRLPVNPPHGAICVQLSDQNLFKKLLI